MNVVIADEIRHAIGSNSPVVALETAVLTAGLPRTPWEDSFGTRPEIIDADVPINVALAKAMTNAVQANGATPVWIGILDGSMRIGLTSDEIIELATDQLAKKVSLATCAQVIQNKESAGTTVAATLLACRLASDTHPIRVFATGGIGGIHQNWAQKLDLSADLTALATTPTCVVSSGAKSILDLHATVAALETIGVPILGLGHQRFPRFFEQGSESDPLVHQVQSPDDVASICHHHWNSLQIKSSVLATLHVPADLALDRNSLQQTHEQAEQQWEVSGLPPTSRTPFLLDYIARATQGKSLVANLALLCNNAAAASEISVAIAAKQ